ncbi:riboflavin biosynthesis protein RibF [Psittacicella hinzii]|uniref:Riboflavin biosynthesis protein n=1 Tax=Psittacicella hinzii TaxID=2028575 RepID=A0A3A1YBX3_9GAMM|nr:riboflavin biosynthesis protein RibF [Psittacicella hinzii]RIY35185.1 riboflavin biosynthesis protein RibF [Psittacicella hinzii]
MRVFHSFTEIAAAKLQQVYLTIGNFDGVHLGHQAILAELDRRAAAGNGQTLLVLFEPQPLEVFANSVPRIFTLEDKLQALSQHQLVDNVLVLDFNQELANTQAQDFVAKICQSMQVHTIFIGDDFHFGKNRQGSFKLLEQLAPQYNYQVDLIDTIKTSDASEQRVSSTLIRLFLKENKLASANKLLAQPFAFVGKVEAGMQLARKLNSPTANMPINRKLSPLHGVYACLVQIEQDPTYYAGVSNIGFKPTVTDDQAHWVVETYIYNFSGDLYGKKLKVIPVEFVRPELKFASIDELKEYIEADKQYVENLNLLEQLKTKGLAQLFVDKN